MPAHVTAAMHAGHTILIVSGEGALGHRETYTGKRSEHAIKLRLARERCNGERWARAEIYGGRAVSGGAFSYDMFTGETVSWIGSEAAPCLG